MNTNGSPSKSQTPESMADSPYPMKLGAEQFALCFGCDVRDIPPESLEIINTKDFRYRVLSGQARDEAILSVLRALEVKRLSVTGADQRPRWERGWSENLEQLMQAGTLDALVPKYIRPGLPLRLFGQFAQASDPWFELNWYLAFRAWLARTYLKDFKNIYEFGCGSGYNIAAFAQMFPDTRIVGFDWAEASVRIVEELRARFGHNVSGRSFNFYDPDKTLDVPQSCVFLTIGALEQTGDKFGTFLHYVLEKNRNWS